MSELLDKPVYEKKIWVGSLVRLVDGDRKYIVTDMWIDKDMITWLRLDHHYIYASYDVRPAYE